MVEVIEGFKIEKVAQGREMSVNALWKLLFVDDTKEIHAIYTDKKGQSADLNIAIEFTAKDIAVVKIKGYTGSRMTLPQNLLFRIKDFFKVLPKHRRGEFIGEQNEEENL